MSVENDKAKDIIAETNKAESNGYKVIPLLLARLCVTISLTGSQVCSCVHKLTGEIEKLNAPGDD